jgi:A/G-specific adenine glycosylase
LEATSIKYAEIEIRLLLACIVLKRGEDRKMKMNVEMEIFKISTIQTALLDWYRQSARILPWRDKPTPYRVWVSEIMLQQTRVEAVKPYFERFMNAAPTVQVLANLPDDQLMKLWEGLGYYSRARNLKKAALVILQEFGGVVPGDVDQLKKLPGIGPYTSGAIASIAYGVRVPAVDGNVLRVMSRILAIQEDIADTTVKKLIEGQVYQLLPYQQVGAFNQALMELGATICLPNGAPKCPECPISSVCEGYLQGIAGMLPVKSSKKDRKIEQKTVFIIRHKDCTAIRQRQGEGLLAGLWELPNEEGPLTVDQVRERLQEWGITTEEIRFWKKAKHIFTHLEWHMVGYYIPAVTISTESPFIMATQKEISVKYSIPSAFKAFMDFSEI